MVMPTDADILAARPPKQRLDPWKLYAFLVEPERSPSGVIEDVATVFLTNKGGNKGIRTNTVRQANDGDSHRRSSNGNSHGPRRLVIDAGAERFSPAGWAACECRGVRSVKGLGRRWVRASNECDPLFSRPVVRRGV